MSLFIYSPACCAALLDDFFMLHLKLMEMEVDQANGNANVGSISSSGRHQSPFERQHFSITEKFSASPVTANCNRSRQQQQASKQASRDDGNEEDIFPRKKEFPIYFLNDSD